MIQFKITFSLVDFKRNSRQKGDKIQTLWKNLASTLEKKQSRKRTDIVHSSFPAVYHGGLTQAGEEIVQVSPTVNSE